MSCLEEVFSITVKVDTPIVVGQDDIVGRRQLIPIISGELVGKDIHGIVLPGGVDSQIISPNGICDLSARYGVRLDDGTSFYIENNGIRTVPSEYIELVKNGEFIDPSLYYFCTTPKFEVYNEELKWLTQSIFTCKATRFPDSVELKFYSIK
jgi:hypothetical protein